MKCKRIIYGIGGAKIIFWNITQIQNSIIIIQRIIQHDLQVNMPLFLLKAKNKIKSNITGCLIYPHWQQRETNCGSQPLPRPSRISLPPTLRPLPPPPPTTHSQYEGYSFSRYVYYLLKLRLFELLILKA